MKKTKIKKKAKDQITKKKNFKIIISAILITIFLILAGYLFYLEIAYAGKIYPNIKLGDSFFLSGKTKDEARTIIEQRLIDYQGKFELVYGRDSWSIIFGSDFSFDLNQTVDEAYNFGRTGGIWSETKDKFSLIFVSNKIDSVLNFSDSFQNRISEIEKKVNQPFRNASLKIINNQVVVVPESEGRKLKVEELKERLSQKAANFESGKIILPVGFAYPTISQTDIASAQEKAQKLISTSITLRFPNSVQKISAKTIAAWLNFSETEDSLGMIIAHYLPIDLSQEKFEVTVNQKKLKEYGEDLAQKIDQPAQNAQLEFTDHLMLIAPDQIGRKLDQVAIIHDLSAILNQENNQTKHEVTLKIEILKAKVRSDNYQTLGITGLISQGVSSFAGSPVNRIHNIGVGSARFNGVLLEPNQKVSFNEILGLVDASTGYLPELVIKENKTVPEYGGGLCQVGTTFFRAALLAGTPILEREPHAYRVLYYDWPYGPGVDATIYPPHPDVRFKNDTDGWILIQTQIKGNKLYFNFYGNKGGRTVTLEGPFTLESNPDGSMKTVFYRHILENGVEVKKDTFNSSYDSPSKYPHPTPTAPESSPGQATPPPTG